MFILTFSPFHILLLNSIIILQEDVLGFIHDSYHVRTGTIEVPKALQMKKDLSERREISQMKGYRTNNRYACKVVETLYISLTCAKRARIGYFIHTHTHTPLIKEQL